MTVNTRVIKLFLRQQSAAYIPLADGLRLQILPNVTYLPRCQKHQFAAFIYDSSLLIVWDDDPKHLLERANNIEDQLMSMIWREEGDLGESVNIQIGKDPSLRRMEPSEAVDAADAAKTEAAVSATRRAVLMQPLLTAATLVLIFAAIGSGWREIAIELVVDKSWVRLAFLAVVPLQIWLALVKKLSEI